MMENLSLENAFSSVEKKAKSDGAQVELLVERSEKFSTSFQKGNPEKFDSSQSQVAGLRVILNGFEGYAFSENLSPEALVDAYGEALKNAQFVAKGGDAATRVELASDLGEVAENTELFNNSLSGIEVATKLERAKALEQIALSADKRIASVPYNGYTESESEVQILTSTGLRRRQRHTAIFGYSYALAREGEENRMGGESFFSRNAQQFNPEEIARKAAEKAVSKLGAVPPETGMYPVVIDTEVAAEFLGLFTHYFSARSVFEKTSLFGDLINKPIASTKLTIVDDPFLKAGVGTRAFDSEGAASKTTPLITNGVLSNYLTNSVYAKRMSLPHTANAARGARSELDISISNMVVKPGTKSLEQLLSSYPKVIYITDFTGYHAGFAAGSGDFSLQSEGELWENGKRVRPLCNFVTSGNVRQFLESIEEVGSRVAPPTGDVVCPDLLIRSLSIAGK